MTQYSFEDALNIDQALQQLATYEVTKGLIVIPKTQDEFITLQDKIVQKFNYFKHLIQSRECTFQYIKKDVLCRNGPFPQPEAFDYNKLDPKQIDELDENNNREKDLNDFATRVLKSFFLSNPNESGDILDKSGIKIIFESGNKLEAPKSSARPKKRSRKKSDTKKD